MDLFDGSTVVPVTWQTAYAAKVQQLCVSIKTLEYPTTTTSHCPTAALLPRVNG